MTASAKAIFQDAVAAHRAGDLRTAEAGYQNVLRIEPGALPALDNLAIIFKREDRIEELAAITRQRLEVQTREELHYALAIKELYLGRYAEAWPHFEHRPTRLSGAPNASFPEWKGESLAGKSIVVWHEQGLGDQIMISRYIPLLNADKVYFACLPPLTRLMGQLCTTLPRLGDARGRFDYWVSSMSLPGRFETSLETIPEPPTISTSPRRLGRVGICWRASDVTNPGRTLPEPLARELLAIPGAISLHPEDTGAADFQDTADIIAGLDTVITVDTAVAHLAGTLRKPTLLMLPHEADWRWMRERSDTPWYRSIRLFRQPEPGDWPSVLAAVKAAL